MTVFILFSLSKYLSLFNTHSILQDLYPPLKSWWNSNYLLFIPPLEPPNAIPLYLIP